MKFFVDLSKKQLIKSAASNVALERVVLKRRDSLAVEVVFVSRNSLATMPAGTTVSVALKRTFADISFLASASGTPPILNLNTVPLEALFTATAPSAIPALLEIRWTVPGETTRTATLTAEVQNSVILGTEGTPEAVPDLKATQTEAQAGTNNEKWMTPLRTAQAIAAWIASNLSWSTLTGKPSTFPPSAHTHATSEVTGLQTALDGKVTAFRHSDTTMPDLAPAALGLRDNEEFDTVALQCDGGLLPQNNPWQVLFPDQFRDAISAADAASLGTLSQQNADAASITGGTAYFDTLEAATAHAAAEGTLTISATGDILGSGTNRLLGFIAGGATY